MMELVIKQELAQAIANYLQERPYREVNGLLNELLRLKEIKNNEQE